MANTTCVCGTPYVMTMAEWKSKHRDFKGVEGGQRFALRYCSTHGTTSAPVTVVRAPKGSAVESAS